MTAVAATVNGEAVAVPPGTSVADLVADRVPSQRGIAVARNLEVVPRSEWAATPVADGDAIEILTAAQGG